MFEKEIISNNVAGFSLVIKMQTSICEGSISSIVIGFLAFVKLLVPTCKRVPF